MTRINTNLPSLMGALYMNRNMEGLNRALERMATGLRINTAKDSPDGVIIGDVLRGELTGIQNAITNAERANNLMAVAEASIANISDLLLDLKGVLLEAANEADLSQTEIKAKQRDIDSLVEAVNTIVVGSSFAGQKLVDGSLSYVTNGVDAAAIADLAINKAPVGAASGEVALQVGLLVSAERGVLVWPSAAVAGNVSVRFTGPEGSEILDFVAGTTSTDVMTAVNSTTAQTGLTAELVNGDPLQGVRISTADYGSRATVRVGVTQGNPADFATEDELGAAANVDSGADVELDVSGSHVIGDGLEAHYASASTDLQLVVNEAWNTAGPPASTDFRITSGGALFQLGPQIGSEQQDSIGIPPLDSTRLGNAAVGYLSEIVSGGAKTLHTGRLTEMIAIVETAIEQVSSVRARVGSFQNNTLSMAIDSLRETYENVASARSSIVDADYAQETAAMVRQQILVDATRAAIAMAQSVPDRILALLLG